MRHSHACASVTARRIWTATVITLIALALPSGALAATKTVRYLGVQLTVPTSWPVFQLANDPNLCVRFDRHAVYLGTPGSGQLCPASAAVGRTEAILVSPRASGSGGDARGILTPSSNPGAAPGGGTTATLVERHAVVTVTWGRHPELIRAALGRRSLRALTRATDRDRPVPAPVPSWPGALPRTAKVTTPSSPATPGEVFSGLGFDACTAPTTAAMSAWGTASPYAAVGIYIGGTNMGCTQANLNSTWISTESAAGWHLVPTYVGLQAPSGSSSCGSCAAIVPAQAAAEGTAAAQDAVVQAQALGIGTGNPIYFDMEGYNTSVSGATTAVLTFLQAWTVQLHAAGYLSGVYSSAASGMVALAGQAGTGYLEPDDIWIADWNNQQTTSDPYVPSTDWAGAQRLHQYEGGHTETYGGVALSIDSDYLDGVTAAAGSATPTPPPVAAAPSLTVTPQTDGAVQLTPQWTGEPGITQYQFLAGESATALSPLSTVSAASTFPVAVQDVYPYFAVEALNASGQVLGTSAPVASPANVAVFTAEAFVSPHARFSVPVACMNAAPCKVHAVVYRGTQRIASIAPESVSRHGGLLHFALGPRVDHIVVYSPKHQLPVTIKFINGAGTESTASLTLVAYETKGRSPSGATGASANVQILDDTALVSNGWVGGIFVACTASTPCQMAIDVTTRSGQRLAVGRTPTVGAGEIAELHFQMTARGHALLRDSAGNQLAARIVVRASTAATADGGTGIGASGPARALAVLDSY